MGNREPHFNHLVCKFCKQSYTSKRSDSEYCSPAHRTAAYRFRKNGENNFLRLNIDDRRFGSKIRSVKHELSSILKFTLEFDKTRNLPFSIVKIAYEKLDQVIQLWIGYKTNAISEQIIWIWENVLPFYNEIDRKSKNAESELCYFRLTSELREAIEKMVEIKRSC